MAFNKLFEQLRNDCMTEIYQDLQTYTLSHKTAFREAKFNNFENENNRMHNSERSYQSILASKCFTD